MTPRSPASGFLLDTHALQWWWCSPRLLSEPVLEVLRDPAQRVVVSAASWFELAEAHRAGQLPGLEVALERFPQLLEADGLGYLPVWPNHLQRAGRAAQSPVDPGCVDRVDALLVAQAELENLLLISLDAGLLRLGARLFW
ncbi:type II toxin-antitoxin system VapC family toxin [Cyanobium sp. ATX 6E8]|uniref:type II toxin-antitoxin system VapC family toxin n=1 Tax=Cyanobium sp. ATX 6E8 TaxID=2823701 RepID=UPI0020CD80E5|nr:type II toxin-antitoxin system VapC family toxin [Cyanobium sp. ATX 6E8]MCP9942287.1 type II toxin-antitoxin system VapC family toxin [Cyanobium sp. ATX 6E8]